MTQSPAIDSAVQKAEEFEKEHYADQTSSGQAQELDASDFKQAAAQAANTVSDAAQSVKDAVVGEPKEGQSAADTATIAAEGDTASPSAPTASAPAAEPAADKPSGAAAGSNGPSLATQIQAKTVETLDSLQKAVEPTPGTESADPEVNNFRDLVGEVFSNMKESIAADKQDKEAAGAATAAGENKAVAASPVEPHNSFLAQMKNVAVLVADKIMPEAHAAGRYGAAKACVCGVYPGEAPDPDGKSKGLIEDLGERAEEAVEAVIHPHDQQAQHREDGKWQDAKDEAREGGRQFNQAARDAADAMGDKTRRNADRAADKTQNFFDQTREAARGVGQETEDLARGAQDRVRRDWPGEQVRGAANEVEDLTERAKDRVVEDWRDLKRGTRQQLDDASATREFEARNAPAKDDRGFFSSLFGWGNGDASKAEDKAREAGDRARQKGREAKEQARETKEQARGWFNSTADEAADKAQEGKEKTRGFFNRAGDEANRLGDKAVEKTNRLAGRVHDTAEDAQRSVQDKLDQAEDYLKADLEPSNRIETELSQGLIPLDTQTVLRLRAREE